MNINLETTRRICAACATNRLVFAHYAGTPIRAARSRGLKSRTNLRESTRQIFLILIVLGCVGRVSRAENWPQWRGPEQNGISRETDLPTVWSESAGIVWKTPIPEWGTSTPAIWNDAIFLTSQTDDGKLLAYRLNVSDGRIVWTREIGASETVREAEKRSGQKFHRLHNGASPSPVTDGTTVVFHFGNGDLAAFDFAGIELWKRNLQADYGPYSIWWGHANSPVLYGDTVINVCMQDSLESVAAETKPAKALSYLVAHDLKTGEVRWYTPRATTADAEQFDSYTTPVFHRTASGVEMIVMGGNQLDAYDPATGKQRWHLGGLVGGRTITGPVVAGDAVFATRGQKGELVGVRLGGSGELADSEILFRHGELTPDSCSPVVWEGRVYTVSDAGIAQCLDAATGAPIWKERLGGDFKASPLAAEGRIYFQSKSGLTTVVKAGDVFEKIAENQLDDETLASPAVSNGRIYLRGRSNLYCVGKK